ncbi:hypothetical protein Mapa_011426 [Marchantia paleacea]|nr:hypothetical protein Mapa_011426 [Marchantia paleacea]
MRHSQLRGHICQLEATGIDPTDQDEGIFGCCQCHHKNAPNLSMRIIFAQEHSQTIHPRNRTHFGAGRLGLAPNQSVSPSHVTQSTLRVSAAQTVSHDPSSPAAHPTNTFDHCSAAPPRRIISTALDVVVRRIGLARRFVFYKFRRRFEWLRNHDQCHRSGAREGAKDGRESCPGSDCVREIRALSCFFRR